MEPIGKEPCAVEVGSPVINDALVSAHALLSDPEEGQPNLLHDQSDDERDDKLAPLEHDEQSEVTAVDASTSKEPWIPLICVQLLVYFHRSAVAGIFLVIPYYVSSTPEHGWTVTDLSIIFAVFNIGGIVASQICMIAELSTTKRKIILFIGHLMQFVLGVIGFVLLSSVLGFNLPLFYVGSFLGGFNSDITILEVYGALTSDDESVQMKMLGSIGKVMLIAGIINAFLLTAIYENLGFQIFCGALCGINLLAIFTLCALWCLITNKRERETDDPVDTVDAASDRHRNLSPKRYRTSTVESIMIRAVESIAMQQLTHSKSFALGSPRSPRTPRSPLTLTTHSVKSVVSPLHIGGEDSPQHNTEESLSIKWLSAPVLVLLLVVVITAFCGTLYATSFSLVFAQDFGINSTVGGYLDAAANVFSFILLTVFLKFSSKCCLFQYPFDILLIAVVFVIGNVLFAVFYTEWIAYSVHWIIRRITVTMMGVQMVSRLFLCPPEAFNKVASIAGLLTTTGYLSGATLGPILFMLEKRLPFVVMAVLNIILIVVVSTVYVHRRRVLSAMDFDDDVKGQYLLMERAANDPDKSEEHRMVERRRITATREMLRRQTTATDVSWHKT